MLERKVIAITGAGRGLGGSIARICVGYGAAVALLDRDESAAKELADELTGTGAAAIAVACDVAVESEVADAVAAVQSQLGTCDGLVNNAGILQFTPLEDLPVAEWDDVMAVNLRGMFLCTKHFGKVMLDKGTGSIVNIASVAGTIPEYLGGAYSASKAGGIMLARQTAVEWGTRGVRANAVSPGIMQTPMAQQFLNDAESYARRVEMVAQGRIGAADEVAEVIAFLLSDRSSYVTAQNIEVDGGMMQMLVKLLPHPGAY